VCVCVRGIHVRDKRAQQNARPPCVAYVTCGNIASLLCAVPHRVHRDGNMIPSTTLMSGGCLSSNEKNDYYNWLTRK
jgi:hypothetical protein